MAHIVADRIRDTTTTTGTGAVTVSGTPPATYKTFSARMTSPSDTCAYFIAHRTADEWECGIGTYSASNTLTRTTVLSSSNSDAVVSLSAGTKDVVLTQIADRGFFPTALVASQAGQTSGDYRIRAMGAFTSVGININNGGGVQIGGDGLGDTIAINDCILFQRQKGLAWAGTLGATTQINQQGTSNTAGITSLEFTTVPQGLRAYNTTDGAASPTNYERGVFDWTTSSNVLTIGAQASGTGTLRNVSIVGNNTSLTSNSGGQLTVNGTNYVQSNINLWLTNNGLALQIGSTPDLGISRGALGVLAIGNSSAGDHSGWLQWGGQSRVSSDFSVTSSTALTNVTGLSVSVAAGRTYFFEAELFVTDAAAGGVQAAIAGTATATAIQYTGYTVADNAIKGKTNATALATAVGSTVTTETSGIVVRISGTITVNAAGTLTVQMAQNTSNGTATIAKRGSWFLVHDMP